MEERVTKNSIEKLRDLVGILTGKPVQNPTYQRYAIGAKVKFYNGSVGAWDVGEVTSVRNRNTYTVRSVESGESLHEWHELRPVD